MPRPTPEETDLRERYPQLMPFKECISRSYAWGVAYFSLVFAATYFGQRAVATHIPFDFSKYHILVSGVLGSAASFKVTKDRIAECQKMWEDSE